MHVAFLCLRAISCLGFHSPPPPPPTVRALFPKPIPPFSTTTTCPNNNIIFQPLIVATQMTKSEDEISEETKNIGYKSGAADAAFVQSGVNEDNAPAAALTKGATVTATANHNDTKASTSTGFSLVLFPILLFKFSIVLLVKFASDIVVYPMLYFYRIVKLGRRKVLSALSNKKKDGSLNMKVNGDSSTSSA